MIFELLDACSKKRKTYTSAEDIVIVSWHSGKSSTIRNKEIVSFTVLWKLTS